MRFGTLQLCDEHARQSAVQTSTKVDPFYAAIWSLFTLRLTYDQKDAAGFIQLNALRLKLLAARDRRLK
jgi:argininosuccinate synthase